MSYYQVDLITPHKQQILPAFTRTEMLLWLFVVQNVSGLTSRTIDNSLIPGPSTESMTRLSGAPPLYWKANISHPKRRATGFDRKQCGRPVGTCRQMDGVSVVRHQGEYIYRLTLCLFDTIKETRLPPCYGWLESAEPNVWPEITGNKVWPCMAKRECVTKRKITIKLRLFWKSAQTSKCPPKSHNTISHLFIFWSQCHRIFTQCQCDFHFDVIKTTAFKY